MIEETLTTGRWCVAALGLLCSLGAAGCGSEPPAGELTPELRSEVAQLKASASATPTTPENLAWRTDVLWDWANAYSLAGGRIPVQLPADVAMVRRALATDAPLDEELSRRIDRHIAELKIREEEPDALGTLTSTSTPSLVAGSTVTIEQVYTVGSRGLPPGAALLTARQAATDQGILQNRNPEDANYVSVRASNPDARLEPFDLLFGGLHGTFVHGNTTPGFRVAGSGLAPGDTVTITYGDRSAGGSGFRVQTWSTEQLLLPVYADLTGDGQYMGLDWPDYEVIGGDPVDLAVFAPSIVAPGETFDITVRAEDRYMNRATRNIPTWRVTLNGEHWGELEAEDRGLALLDGIMLGEPGTYRFTVTSEDGSISGTSNPIWVVREPELRVLWGETHVHTAMTDGQGTAEQVYRYAQDDARLDFLAFSEHDVLMDASEWRRLQELARSDSEAWSHDRMVAFLAYEWTVVRDLGGHHNVVFRRPDAAMVPLHNAPELSDLYRGLHEQNQPEDVLVIPHAHQAARWTRSDPALQRLVEMYSMQGTFEWFANLYLQNGFRLGMVGASDDHRGRPGHSNAGLFTQLQTAGLTAVVAPEKAVDPIFDALRNRSTYATSGERILLEAHLDGQPIGSVLSPAELVNGVHLSCKVSGTSPFEHIDVIKNGRVILSRSLATGSIGGRSWLRVGFQSSSEVFPPPRDNPRGYRLWKGTIELNGARILRVDASGLDNRYVERARIDPTSDGTRLHFQVETRGRVDPLLLELEGCTPATTLDVRLDPTTEFAAQEVLVRRPAQLPAGAFSVRVDDVVRGVFERTFDVGQHVDRMTFSFVDPGAPLDQSFEFADLDMPSDGDYYYLRISQLDGGRAWSSPWWIGAPRKRSPQ